MSQYRDIRLVSYVCHRQCVAILLIAIHHFVSDFHFMKFYTTLLESLWWSQFPASPHDDVIKWKQFPRYWLFVRGIHRSPVNSSHKGQWRGALMFSLICVWINGWVNNRGAGDLRRYRAHYDVTVMLFKMFYLLNMCTSFDTCAPPWIKYKHI